MVRRIYAEKKTGFDVEANMLLNDLKNHLGVMNLEKIRIINRYDVENVSEEVLKTAKRSIFSEPPVDFVYDEEIDIKDGMAFAVEFLPGQYDQRADSASQCIQILTQQDRPVIKTAKVYVLYGNLTDEHIKKIKQYCINPVEARQAKQEKPQTLEEHIKEADEVKIICGFTALESKALTGFIKQHFLAMDEKDLEFCISYFKDVERRDPTMTEIKMIDTYWSDHCRHTTFSTNIENVVFDENAGYIKAVYEDYLSSRKKIYKGRQKALCLMDIATIAAKKLKLEGGLKNLDESEEINACSIVVDVDVDGQEQKWLVMFKNETHNHPTEIEPFGGAATCLGGAIRDPLSGRSYVYQAMRVTGSADPTVAVSETLPGKLPQRKITTGAAHGYSSYGNQIGLSTGLVKEIYHPGYMAKRMEIGAVIAAVPYENVVRKRPEPNDVIILLGGRTGRDGCGGATGSSKAHTLESLEECGAEVQKGNPPEERKLQRLFRNKEAARLIKRCNDFGAGGVSVAVGELADGLIIDLDKLPKKYDGLDGTELAISESQERMAVVLHPDDVEKFCFLAIKENIEATLIAVVTSEPRLKMKWKGRTIVDISREFLNSNGASKYCDIKVETPSFDSIENEDDIQSQWIKTLSDLNICSQKGLVEMFDSTIGAGTVLMPYGGKYQLTHSDVMAAKIPLIEGNTNTATLMSYGYDPYLSERSPFHGAVYAIISSVSKIVAAGGLYSDIYLTLQEYFEKLGDSPEKWGKPFSALLGAFLAQMGFGIAAIGGKDSMSGSFDMLNVPATLVSFAVAPAKADKIVSSEFKKPGSKVVVFLPEVTQNNLPDFECLKSSYKLIYEAVCSGKVLSARAVGMGGISEAISLMCFGNKLGFEFNTKTDLFSKKYGGIVLEIREDIVGLACLELGRVTLEKFITYGDVTMDIEEQIKAWEKPLSSVFAPNSDAEKTEVPNICFKATPRKSSVHFAKPRIFIPVFPGTNCEYDSQRAFEKAGGAVSSVVFKNLNAKLIEESVDLMVREITNSQIIMIPGGFSAGDEPEGSGKFIATVFRNPKIAESVTELLNKRDGLVLGICNGFQALVKLGLLPYGEIKDLDETSPTLTFNTINRHMSTISMTKIVSSLSPWLVLSNLNDIHSIAISHGEGKFVASKEVLEELKSKGQIATQYVDFSGNATASMPYNPNGSMWAIEGITSPDGRVLGKMGHSERIGNQILKNIEGNKDQRIFEAGVTYFK